MFEEVRFKGQFRSYQQKIIDKADQYLQDGHIHIVAAPGSGKTVLGLELICQLGRRALILSPTTTIRNQWGERFADMFIGGEGRVSNDLRHPADITSVTYQALSAAMRQKFNEEDGSDYTSFDLLDAIEKNGIGTVCLDEAHHLQNEWQKSLEAFLRSLDGVKTIALTATPPYDASPGEWDRYIAMCGEIDEEIFVPELVKQGTLCPHQDYVYFNYPTAKETEQFEQYRKRAAEALRTLFGSEYIKEGYVRLAEYVDDYDFLYNNVNGIAMFLILCAEAGVKTDKRLFKRLALRKPFRVTPERLETGVNFLIKVLLGEEEGAQCLKIFKEKDLVERGCVSLGLNERLRRHLLSSVGKLKGIEEIIAHENVCMGGDLRLLILTDYIKKESISVVGSAQNADSVSVVSVYETARRTGVPVGALSGSLVILPRACAPRLKEYGADFRMSGTADAAVYIYEFSGSNQEKVGYVSRLFEEGKIRVLVGTKSLLGEGWDAPFVNALILASFVGSFMLSNQMRGRAIRVYAGDAHKTANIWHLVTVERPHLAADSLRARKLLKDLEEPDFLLSYDFQTVSRRFECFAAPDYETGNIRSGIARISVIHPPYDEKGIERINREMLDRSARRGELWQVWHDGLDGSARLNEVSEVPKQTAAKPPYIFVNFLAVLFVFAVMQGAVYTAVLSAIKIIGSVEGAGIADILFTVFMAVLAAILLYFAVNIFCKKLLVWLSPKKSIEKIGTCILKTMQEVSLISRDARLGVVALNGGTVISIELLNSSVHDQNLFHGAIEDAFLPIRNPRYILIPTVFGRYSYRRALACPEILAAKGEYAQALAQNLKAITGKLCVVYTRTEAGRKLILKCRNAAYITKNHAALHRFKRISRWE